jgi:hypothetical protein
MKKYYLTLSLLSAAYAAQDLMNPLDEYTRIQEHRRIVAEISSDHGIPITISGVCLAIARKLNTKYGPDIEDPNFQWNKVNHTFFKDFFEESSEVQLQKILQSYATCTTLETQVKIEKFLERFDHYSNPRNRLNLGYYEIYDFAKAFFAIKDDALDEYLIRNFNHYLKFHRQN